MNEIKTVDERLKGVVFSRNINPVSTEEFVALNDEASELLEAYKALQKENAELKEINESLYSSSKFAHENQKRDLLEMKAENAEQAKRIAELIKNNEVK